MWLRKCCKNSPWTLLVYLSILKSFRVNIFLGIFIHFQQLYFILRLGIVLSITVHWYHCNWFNNLIILSFCSGSKLYAVPLRTSVKRVFLAVSRLTQTYQSTEDVKADVSQLLLTPHSVPDFIVYRININTNIV